MFHKRRPHETTVIFQQADEIIKQESHETPILLSFDSANTRLKLWMISVQDKFGFYLTPDDPDAYRVTATKTYG